MSGTNATSLVTIVGDRGLGAPNGSNLTLHGANGSLGSAPLIQAFAGAQFIIDNNLAFAAGGDTPTIPAAQNNNRIRDDAEIQLREGVFIYRGLAAAAASETFGNLNVSGGHNNVTLTPNGGGTVTLTANGNLTLGPRVHAPGHLRHARRGEQVVRQRHTAGRRRDRHPLARRRLDRFPHLQWRDRAHAFHWLRD